MQLNKIILNGFKSFGEKTVIEFQDNLNGIVGPNGSGKSNIIDGIKWVLGQQKSGDLRTKANTDIIFAGSENKKAKNVAEVTLFFDNQDEYLELPYKEVAIKRRLFRTGESEYFINETKCRLKDVENLVLDKGFGKNSFSIISQGKVEEIIMSKAIKKREIVDEVAGVQKYRIKKNKTLKRLDKVSQNIEKIEFIVLEVENIIEPLKKASEKAKIYNKLKEELTIKEKNLIANKIFYLAEELTFNEKQNLKIKEQIKEQNNIILQKEQNIANLNNFINDSQKSITTYNEELNKLANEEIILSNRLELIKEKDKVYAQTDNQKRYEYLEKIIKDLTLEIEQISFALSKTVPEKNSTFTNLNNLKIDQQQKTMKLYTLKQEAENHKIKEQNSKIPYAVRSVLGLNKVDIIGTVKNNLNIKVGYEVAIMTILGNRQNEIIANNEQVVKECIDYLKQNKLPRVTFIPLNKVVPRFLPKQTKDILTPNNCLGSALSFVEYNPKYEKAFSTLLGNVIICQNLLQANKLNTMLPTKHQIVTLEGDIIMPNGKISGGYDKKVNQLEQQNLIKNIKLEIEEFNTKVALQETEIQKLSTKYSELDIEVKLQENKVRETKTELQNKTAEYERLLKNSPEIDQKIILELNDKLTLVKENKLKLIKNINKIKNDIQESLTKKEIENDLTTEIRAEYKQQVQTASTYEIKEQRTKELIENQRQILREKYSISYQKAYEESIKINNLQQYETEVKELKRQIKELGFINLEAITQYETENEKLQYYRTNLQDLLQSKIKIEEVLAKIDKFVITKFTEVFEKLNLEFQKIFKQLFDGGNATLLLTNPEDILETGVEIIAQPPGKKSQVIGLLSGGEKALTAISLLFAILKIRVVPFAILDEVEAALDEANVSRYIEYLQVFSKNTQFLIITHRQTTMENLDKLYGVTMIEKGVSSVIDIKMSSNKNKKL